LNPKNQVTRSKNKKLGLFHRAKNRFITFVKIVKNRSYRDLGIDAFLVLIMMSVKNVIVIKG